MRILFYSDKIGTTPFITNLIAGVSEKHDTKTISLSIHNNVDQLFPVKQLYYQTSFLSSILRDRLERHDIRYDFSNSAFRDQLNREIQSFNPDIIHIQFGYDALRIFDNYHDEDRKVVIHFRGYDASSKFRSSCYRKKIQRILMRPNVYALFVSKHLLNNLYQSNIHPVNTPQILYSLTDLNFFHRKQEPTNKHFNFVQISSFRNKKGHRYTIEAFKLFLNSVDSPDNFQLIFTGFEERNSYCKEVQKFAAKLGLDQVQFLGRIGRTEARDLIESSQVGVLHSYTADDGNQEGIPNFLMEAMAMELPVVSTLHAGIPELVSKEAHGYLSPEKNVEAFAKNIGLSYENWRISPENRRIIASKFNKEINIEHLLEYYKKIKDGN